MTPFDITSEDLGHLNAYEAVRVFHALLFAEAACVGGVDLSKIDVPMSTSAINTPDGGIDAEVVDAHPANGSHGIIKEGRTSYQIKSGNVDIRNLSDAKRMVSASGALSPRVRSCLAEGGTYVVVLFGSDRPDNEDGKSESLVRQAINEFAPDLKDRGDIEVWKQNKLCGFISSFPSICLLAKRVPPVALHSMSSWNDLADMRKETCFGAVQVKAIDSIRDSVASNPIPMRVIGEPGIGKTRLVMEALKVEPFASLVIYAPKPSVLPHGFLRELSFQGCKYRCILVVDECPKDIFRDIWNQLDSASDRVRLIGIYNEAECAEPTFNLLSVPPLETQDVKTVIAAYGIPEDKALWAAKLCDGSPRVAHIVGSQMKLSGVINISSYEDVWQRYVASRDEIGSELYTKRLRTLEWLSLFARFGYREPFAEEGDQVVRKIACETGMCVSEIREIINYLREKKILQGDRTLYITPKLLHLWLWGNWWKKQGDAFAWASYMTVDESGEQLCDSLVSWFVDMLQYARESVVVPAVIKGLLGCEGPFSDVSFIATPRGSKLLRIIADIDPEIALDYVERYIHDLGDLDLRDFKDGRRCLVDTLKRTAFEPHLFSRTASLLLRLACAENEAWSNNATGEYADLFSVGYGPLASSKASPAQRLPVLRSAAMSDSVEAQRVAIKAMECGLQLCMSKVVGMSDADRLREPMQGWVPLTYGEIWDGFRDVWTLGMECLAKYDCENRQKLAGMLQSRAVGLLTVMGDGTEPARWLKDLYETGFTDQPKLINDVALVLRYSERLSEPARTILEDLKRRIDSQDFEGRLRRYAGTRAWAEEHGENGEESPEFAAAINGLAEESIERVDELKRLLPWLVGKEPENAYRFGAALGEKDVSGSLWSLIVSALKGTAAEERRGSRFCFGYLQSVYHRDRKCWNDAIAELREDNELVDLLPGILSDEGISDEALGMLVSLYMEGCIAPDVLKPLGFCNHLDVLSNESVCGFLSALVGAHDNGLALLAIEITFRLLKADRPLPAADLASAICQPELFSNDTGAGGLFPYMWSESVNGYLELCPGQAEAVIDVVVERLDDLEFVNLGSLEKMISRLAQLEPEATWNAIGERLLDGRRFSLIRMGVDKIVDALAEFPVETVLSWIGEDPERRAYMALECFPAALYDDKGDSTITREIIAKYGDQEAVQQEMWAKARDIAWVGSIVDYYEARIAELEACRKDEKNPHVLTYIDRTISDFRSEQEKERMREERMEW